MSRTQGRGRPRIISMVSGKGGTGKTLLTTVIGRTLAREGLKVLLIDFDIFVRGLTILLASHSIRGLRTNESQPRVTVSDLLLERKEDVELLPENLAIFRFFECDILAACSAVNEPLGYEHENLSSVEFGRAVMERIISSVKKNDYDVIIVDNRASLDSLVLAACSISDVIISVAEDDILCKQTNRNLVDILHTELRKIDSEDLDRPVYTILNKGRRITNYDELKRSSWNRPDFNTVGTIPFDIEIMDSFGEEKFWTVLYESLFFRAFIEAWNNLAGLENLASIQLEKYRFPPSIFMSRKSGRSTLLERMVTIYGVIMIMVGVVFVIIRRFADLDPFEVISLLMVIAGLVAVILTTDFRRLLSSMTKPKIE